MEKRYKHFELSFVYFLNDKRIPVFLNIFNIRARLIKAPITQPKGHDNQMPVDPQTVDESTNAKATLSKRSVKVAIIKLPICSVPLKTPSLFHLTDITQ